jgi:hypothetical protein
MRQALRGEFKLPDDDALHGELVAIGFKYTSAGAIQIEDKAATKRRLGGMSIDLADSCALTFADGPPGTRLGKSSKPRGFGKGDKIHYVDYGVA